MFTIGATLPGFAERIPHGFVISELRNVEGFTYPKERLIYVQVVVINHGDHFLHNCIPGALHFGGARKY